MTNNIRGIFTALLTPFDDRNRVNTDALRRLVRYNPDQEGNHG